MYSSFRVLIFFTVLSVIGLGLAPRLPLNFLPPAGETGLTVNYQWPNASPELIELELTTPLEGVFALIEGIEKITSVSGEGSGRIQLELDQRRSIDYIRFELASRIRQLYSNFPEEVPFPLISLSRPEDEQNRPLLTYSLGGDATLSDIYRYASEILSPELSLIQGIRQIDVTGGKALEWMIRYQVNNLERLGLKPKDIQKAIQEQFKVENLGITTNDEESFYVNLNAQNDELRTSDWAKIPLKLQHERVLYLGDVATVELREQAPVAFYRINGQNSIRLLFYPEVGVNTINLANELQTKIDDLRPSLPNTYQLYLDDDATEYIRIELLKIRDRSLLSLSILLLFVLLVYRSWRYLLVITLSLIANLGLAFIFYYWMSVQLHLYALAGITVSFGIIIDNAIVMAHHWRKQHNLKVFPALLASTLTSVAALVIVFFLPERWQLNLFDFAQVIIINLSVSLLVALFLIPALMETLQASRPNNNKKNSLLRTSVKRLHLYRNSIHLLLHWRPLVILIVILAFGLPVFLLPNYIEGWKWYNKSLGSSWYLEKGKPVVNRVLGGSLRLFSWYVYEGGGYREPKETVIYVQGSMPPGATPQQLDAVIQQIEKYLDQFDVEIKQYASQVNNGQFGQISIYFQPQGDISFPFLLKNRLTAYATNMGGVAWKIYGVGRGFSNEIQQRAPRYKVAMYGYNKDELLNQSKHFKAILLQNPRIQEVNIEANMNWWEKDRFEYNLDLNNKAMIQAGLQDNQLHSLIQNFNQIPQNILYLPNGRPVHLSPKVSEISDKWALENVTQGQDSSRYQLGRLLNLSKEKVSSSLHKENQQYLRMIEFEFNGSGEFGSLYLKECMEVMRLSMPLGYTIARRSFRRSQEQKRLNWLMSLVVALIFFICTVYFESIRKALIIILLIPISFIGIFLTFYLFDFYFDQGGYIAFIMVSGLSVNSLILILSDYQRFQRKQPHRSALDLYVKAYRHKITPIILSVLSTALGLIPFMIYGDNEVFWFALAVGTIGGLIFSLLVISLITPVFWIKKPSYSSSKRQ